MLLQGANSATPMVPSSTVVAHCARTLGVAFSADVPLSSGATGHDDQTRSRQAAGWAAMGVSSQLVPGAEANCERTRCPPPLLSSRRSTGHWR